MRATYPSSTCGMVLAPGLEVVFGQPPADGLAGDTVVLGELDHLTRQQLQGPTGAALWWLGTGEQGFLLARQLVARSGRGCSLSAASRLPSTKRCLVR
jgi:hypothetical protein